MAHSRVTIKDVAAEAGVSITTVSHVLNDVPGKRVNPNTRTRVRETAARLGYTPNALARSLRTNRSGTIGLVSDEIATTPFAGQIILGAQQSAKAHDSVLLITTTGYEEDIEEREITELLRRQVDGVLYAAMYHRAVTIPKALAGVPVVALNASTDDPAVSWVVPDEVAGGWDATDVLVKAGHRRIAFLNNIDDIPARHGREQGFRDRIAAAGLPAADLRIRYAEAFAPGGYAAARALLTEPDRPTAVFCFNDRVAMGAYRAARELGLTIPDDLSIVGYDDQEYLADGLYPGLTTVALPHYDMGTWAAERLFDRINAPPDASPATQTAKLRGPVIIRDSVTSPPR